MKVSIEWLSEYVDIEESADELADLLSLSGTEVDRVTRLGSGVTGVVAARVTGVKPHPNADALRLAVVDDGTVIREVVCGAPNLKEGMVSALAVSGATLPAVSAKPVSKARIRGIESDGMLVSAAELGISDDHSGIIELGAEVQTGLDIHDILSLEDVVLDVDITPNRPDCMSMVGMAREVAALTGGQLRMPDFSVRETGGPIEDLITIRTEDLEGCPRYTARAVTGVKIAPSPPWMQRRLVAAGLRPISNVVDVTNYVLLELGQPLHAFDMELLGGRTIIVRKARRGEVMTTLDDVERQLDDRSLVIADEERPVALAGIIGGEDSEVRDNTTNILIESAYFDPKSILLTSKRLGVRTEASARFERGTDPEGTRLAADRAALLMASLAGGSTASGVMDVYPTRITPVTIQLRPGRVNRILGSDISKAEMVEILERLEAAAGEGDVLDVTVPSFRHDLEREIDLIEEIARVHGLDGIPGEVPSGAGFDAGLSAEQQLDERLTDALISRGISQVISYSFMHPGDLDLLGIPEDDELRRVVTLINPIAETGEVMRTNMLPGLLRIAVSNANRGNRDLSLFEKGRVFMVGEPDELPEEREVVGIVMCGQRQVKDWLADSREVDFFDLKGAIEDTCAEMGVPAEFSSLELPFLAPGRSANIVVGGGPAGFMGQLHPSVAEAFGLEQDAYVAEFSATAVTRSAALERSYTPVGRFPNVKVDIAAIVDANIEAGLVEEEILASGGELLRSVRLFDVYSGQQIPDGKKSLAYALEFGSASGTLTDELAHAEMDRVIDALKSRFEASIRGRDVVEGEGR